MKKSLHYVASLFLIIVITMSSCVSKKKFVASQARVANLQQDSVTAVKNLKSCNLDVENLKSDQVKLQSDFASVQKDLKVLSITSKLTIADQAARLRTMQDIVQKQKDVMFNLKKHYF